MQKRIIIPLSGGERRKPMDNTAILNQILDVVLELKAGMERLDQRMDQLEIRVGALEARMDHVETRLSNAEKLMSRMEKRMSHVENQLGHQQQELLGIRSVLEMDIVSNISIIAENHLNLDRKLNLFLTQLETNTDFRLRVNYLDMEVRKIKTHLKLA